MKVVKFTLLTFLFLGLCGVCIDEAEAGKKAEWHHNPNPVYNNTNWVSISNNGEYMVAAAGSDGNLSLFHVNNSQPLWKYTNPTLGWSASISANGTYIVASIGDGIALFNKESSDPLWTWEDSDSQVGKNDISADGEYIVVGNYEGVMYLFHKDSNQPLWNFTADDWLYWVSISADGEYIVAHSDDGYVHFFNKESSTPLWSYDVGGWGFVSISADGEYVVSSDTDGDIHFFDQDGNNLWNYTAEKGRWFASAIDISADGEYMIVGDQSFDINKHNQSTVYLFNKNSNVPLWNYTGDFGNQTVNRTAVAISGDGEYIVVGSFEQRIYLFGKDSNQPMWIYSTDKGDKICDTCYPAGALASVSISGDGEYIVGSVYGGNIYLLTNNIPPVANIDSIYPLKTTFNESISFGGTASDIDGEIVAYEWNSSIDGSINYNKDFSITNLSVGNHTIYFRAQDNDGEWSDWTFMEGVIVQAIPIATIDFIESPVIGYFEDWEAYNSSRLQWYTWNQPWSFNGTGHDSDGYVVAYEWVSNLNGFMSNQSNFGYYDLPYENNWRHYLTPGLHTVSFRVQDNDGHWSEWDSADFVTQVKPYAKIHFPKGYDQARFDEEVAFDAFVGDIDGTIVSYEWVSNIDGVLSNQQSFSLSEFSVGEHRITLSVYDNDGLSNEYNTYLSILPNDEPSGLIESIFRESIYDNYEYDDYWALMELSGCNVHQPFWNPENDDYYRGVCISTDSVVSFNSLAQDYDGTIVKYEWVSDIDGILSEEQNFTTTGLSIGIHTISLRVQDNDGNWSTVHSHRQFTNFGAGYNSYNLEVIANFYPFVLDNSLYNPLNPYERINLLKSDNLITVSGDAVDPDGDIVLYCWTLDNEAPLCSGGESDYIIELSKLDFGSHTLTLSVTDNDGASYECPGNNYRCAMDFSIYELPVAYAGDDITIKPNSTVDFYGQGSDVDGQNVAYEWDLDGDGFYEMTTSSFSYKYVDEGVYMVSLRVTDNHGYNDTDSLTITVTNNPEKSEGNNEDRGNLSAPSFIIGSSVVLAVARRRR